MKIFPALFVIVAFCGQPFAAELNESIDLKDILSRPAASPAPRAIIVEHELTNFELPLGVSVRDSGKPQPEVMEFGAPAAFSYRQDAEEALAFWVDAFARAGLPVLSHEVQPLEMGGFTYRIKYTGQYYVASYALYAVSDKYFSSRSKSDFAMAQTVSKMESAGLKIIAAIPARVTRFYSYSVYYLVKKDDPAQEKKVRLLAGAGTAENGRAEKSALESAGLAVLGITDETSISGQRYWISYVGSGEVKTRYQEGFWTAGRASAAMEKAAIALESEGAQIVSRSAKSYYAGGLIAATRYYFAITYIQK